MPRVLHCVEQFLKRSETFVYTLVNGHRLYEASILCQSRIYANEFPFPRIHVQPKPITKRAIGWWIDRSVAHATGRSLWRRGVELMLDRIRPDVVHAHFGPAGCDLVEITKAAGVPLVTSLYGVDAAVLPYLPRWRDAYARLFRDGDLFLAEAPEMRRKVIAAGAPADRTVVQPIAIDTASYPAWAPEPQPTVLFVGRFVPKKGLLDAIAAFDRARAYMPAARLTIVGDGPDEADARALLDRLGCWSAVSFAGSESHQQVIARLATASVLIVPSATAPDGDSEGGAPTVLLEAQTIGTPVVTTRHADIPNVVSEGPGAFLCAEHDLEALGQGLVAALRARHPSSRSKVVADHGVGPAIGRLEALYARLVAGAAVATR